MVEDIDCEVIDSRTKVAKIWALLIDIHMLLTSLLFKDAF